MALVGGYFCRQRVIGAEPRPTVGEGPSDAELAGTWGPFFPNPGTHERDGSRLTLD